MRLRFEILAALCLFMQYSVQGVPYEFNADFRSELDPARFQVSAGKPDAVKVENNNLVIHPEAEPVILDFSFYPLRNWNSSRPAFGNFKAQLGVRLEAQRTPFRWGVNSHLRDAVELEIEPDKRRGRIVGSENGQRTFSTEWRDLPAAESGVDSFSLLRVGKQLEFRAGNGGKSVVLGAWKGELPPIVDFSIKIPAPQTGEQMSVTQWNIQPLPRFQGYTEILPRPGHTITLPGGAVASEAGGTVGGGYIWSTGEKAELLLRVGNPDSENKTYLLQTEVTDIQDRPVCRSERRISLKAGEERQEPVALPSDRNGYFNLRTRLFDDAGEPLEPVNAAGFAITAGAAPDQLSDKAVLGVHGYPFSRNGAKHVRYWDNGGRKMFWAGIEAKPGEWDFSQVDAYVDKTLAAHMTPLVVLAATPEWASTEPQRGTYIGKGAYAPPRDINDWRTYCRRMATRLKGRVRDYEVWNEPNNNSLAPRGFFFHGDVNAYLALVRAAYEEIKAVDPDARILAPSGTGNFFPFLDKFMELGGGNYFDILSIHTYCTPLPPEIGYYFNNEKSYASRIERSRGIMKKYGFEKPIWNTEIGYHSGQNMRIAGKLLTADRIAEEGLAKGWPNWRPGWPFRPLDPRRSAAFFTRFGLLSMVYGVERVYIHHRLNEPNRDPYTALPAVGFMNRLFDGARFVRSIPVPETRLQLHEFELADGKTAVAAWQVYPETLMMNRKADEEVKNVDSAPVDGIADQKTLSPDAMRQISGRSSYFKPGSLHYLKLSPSKKPDQIYDMWGNPVPEAQLDRVGEEPLYLIYQTPPPGLTVAVESGEAIPAATPDEEKIHGGPAAAIPVKAPTRPEELLGKLINIDLRRAEQIDGTVWDRKGWLELNSGQGIAFRPDSNFPKRGRLLMEVRSGNNLNSFGFKYALERNGSPVAASEWPVFPHREIMRGKGWVLAGGYLISEPIDFDSDTVLTLHAEQGNSHVLRIGIIPEK